MAYHPNLESEARGYLPVQRWSVVVAAGLLRQTFVFLGPATSCGMLSLSIVPPEQPGATVPPTTYIKHSHICD